ncbi:MAG TPA: tetratricopeptide repeat protein [Allosphingosinicella sp.]|nr:tetratricopeptide repeat protein [Allosphingosinicella sp.]
MAAAPLVLGAFGALALAATPASARVDRRSPLLAYAEARAAASAGALERASTGFGAALAAAPDSDLIAGQALAHAVRAGDWRLALDATRALERRNALAPDGRFLLVAEAFRGRDWRAARVQIDAIEREQAFAFAVPVLRAWLAFGSREGDPLAALAAAGESGAAAGYAAEHRALLKLALGRADGPAELLSAARSAGARGARLRIAGAALLAGRRQREAALALLDPDQPSSRAARALIESGRPVPGAIGTAEAGVGESMVRLALDLGGQNLPEPGTMFARLAARLDAGNSEAWIVAAELLGQQDLHRLGVGLLANVAANDPFAASAREARIRLLLGGGDRDGALAVALEASRARSATMTDWVRLGQVYADLGRQQDAADAFGRALALHREDAVQPAWTLWLMRGGALDQADNWPEALSALRQAYRLAPEQPFVLNYLGYAQLVRRENIDEAERLIREAHRLAPDDADITDSLGWALYLKGQLPEAIALLEQAARGQPADVEINEHLGDAYFAAGRRVEARFAWRAAAVYATGPVAARIAAKMESGLTRVIAAR